MPKDDCQCQSWKTNRDRVPGLFLLQSAENLVERAAVLRFQFCPWCGTKLEDFGTSITKTDPTVITKKVNKND